MIAAVGVVAPTGTASAAADPASEALGVVLDELGVVIATASSVQELAEAIPLTGVAPAGSEALDLLNSFHAAIANVQAAIDVAGDAPADIGDELEAADSPLGAGFDFVIGCEDDDCTDPGEQGVEVVDDGGVIDYTIPIAVTRTTSDIPLQFESDVFDMSGENLTLTFSLSTTLDLRFDTNLFTTDPTADDVFSLTTPPSVSIAVSADAASIAASTRIGVADATVTLGNLDLDVSFVAPTVDPDGLGGLTRDEWMNTLVSDLVGEVSRTGTLIGGLTFESSLLTSAVGPVAIDDGNLSDGYDFTLSPSDLGSLVDFTLISPPAIIAGIGQAAAGIGGAQAIGDVELPFISGSVRRLAQASRPILDIVDSLGVICGTEGGETEVPTGSVEDLPDGTTVYCRAYVTTGVDGPVSWTSSTATPTTNAASLDTIGTAPTENAVFVKDGDGDFDAQVTYTATFDDDNDGTTDRTDDRTSIQPPLSVQQLGAVMDDLAGGALPDDLFAYDPTTRALTADIDFSVDPGAVTFPVNVGGQLEADTGVAGLQTTSGDVTADAGPVSIDLTAGVFLLPESDWDEVVAAGGGCPDPSIVDPAACSDALNLFFVGVDPGEPEFAIEDASFVANSPTLSGQLGFLEVTAAAQPFQITKADGTKPVLRVDLEPQPGAMTVKGTPVENAIPLRELLFDITDRTSVDPLNLKFEGGFDITASLNGSEIGTAGVDVVWNPVSVGAPVVTPDVNFDALFANFNPVPNLFGTATNTTASTTVLEASGATFTDSAIGARLVNMTDGSYCEVVSVGPGSLTCAEPLGGAENSEWNDGDLYRVEIGSPLALLETLLDNLDQIVAVIENAGGPGLGEALDTELPIVGISPRDLLGQISEIRRTIDEIRQPAADVQCGGELSGGNVTGDPNSLTFDASGEATIYCQAIHNKPATEVAWSVTNGGGTVTANADAVTTVGADPSDAVTVVLSGGTSGAPVTERSTETPGGFQVTVDFVDNDGPHESEYPSLSQPNSIQKLADVVREKLGLPADSFQLDLGDADTEGVLDDLVLELSVGRCNSDAMCPGASNMPPLSSSINADVDGFGGLVSASSDGDVQVDYNADATLKLAFADLLTSPMVYVMPGTGITLQGRFAADDLNFEAAFGPFAVKAGTEVLKEGAGTPETDDDVPGLGTVQLGAQLTIGDDITSPVAIGDFLAGVGTYLAPDFTALDSNDCGTILIEDVADPDPDITADLTGLGCAAISLGISAGSTTNYVADLGLVVEPDFTITPYIPDDLAAQFAAAALDWELLFKALPEIIGTVEQSLRASAADAAGNTKIPIVGDALDAGADVAGALREAAEFIVDSIPQEVYDATTVADLRALIQGFVYDQLSSSGLLRTADGTEAADDPTDIVVIARCGGAECADGDSPLGIDDLRVIFGLGQETDYELPFDLGMDGVPLRLAGALTPGVSWNFVVDLGLSREDGPYIGISDPGGNVRPDEELALVADITLGDAADPASTCPDLATSPIAGNFANGKCIAGQLAFLEVKVVDNGDNPTRLALTTGLDLTNGSESTIGFNNAADVSLEPSLTIDANVDLAFRTGIVGGQSAGFPSVVGHVGLEWGLGLGGGQDKDLAVTFDQLHLDVGPLIEKFLDPILKEVRRFTGPFQPVIDTLTAPIPVVSDLAEMVGQPPVTMLGLMELISGNDLSLIQSIAAFISFVNNAPTGGGYFSLGSLGGGSFDVDPVGGRQAQGPTSAASLVQNADAYGGSLFEQGLPGSDIDEKAAVPTASTKANLPGTFGVPGLTFPFIDNPSQIFGLIMGQDITLVRYDFGPLEASAGFSYNFPPIMVGPVPIAIGVGGSVTVRGRFAVGYDTSGLRKVLSGASGIYLFDGIFIDDLDANGVDVPEISFIGEVYAQAGVSVVIASAGIVAGLRITVDLNLNDSPEPDGKLRIEEIFNKLQNPLCLFDVSGRLEAFIKAFVELNLFITSIRFEFTLLELELLNFEGKCAPPKPVLARVEITDAGASPQEGKLVLHMGPQSERNKRNISTEVEDEEFTVRPINADGGYSVSAFGVYQTYGIGGEFDGGVKLTAVEANAGTGDDTLSMLPGAEQERAPEAGTGVPVDSSIPFTIAVDLSGGPGNDVIQGGDGNDTLDGDGENDRLQGGKGIDTITGGDGADTINGEEGDDILSGGNGTDQIQGGPGNDVADGGADADLVQGGPGTDAPGGTDGNDDLAGGTGPDTVEGGTGNDKVYGDERVTDLGTCADDTAEDPDGDELATDKVSGGDGDDVVWGGDGDDELFGGSGDDLLCGNQGADLMEGDAGAATTETDTNTDPQVDTSGGDDTAYGGSGQDTITGNWGHDWLLGNADSDLLSGGPGNDDVSGGGGNDRVNGDAGIDILVGDGATIDQSGDKAARTGPDALELKVTGTGTGTGGVPSCGGFSNNSDLADCIRGGAGGDLIFGEGGNDDIDGGTDDDIIHAGDGADNPVRGNQGDDLMFGNEDADNMFGDAGRDEMYGNAGADTMRGGIDDDYMEGNQDGDIMRGEAGQDDMIGGSSSAGVSDGADWMYGGALADVMVGDNGRITRPADPATEPDDATVANRSVTLLDVNDVGPGGNDVMLGEDANDLMFGGNWHDVMSGGSGRDLIEGNDGNDFITGDTGDDRIVGGTSGRAALERTDGTPVTYSLARDNSSDGSDSGDTLFGNGGDDVILGDNAIVTVLGGVDMTADDAATVYGHDVIQGLSGQDRLYGQLGQDEIYGGSDEDYLVGDLGIIDELPTGTWPQGEGPAGAPIYGVDLDLGPDLTGLGGPDDADDLMYGNDGNDHLFGVGGDDEMYGGNHDDYMEGNGGVDEMYGDDPALPDATGQDDMIGGSSADSRDDVVRFDDGEELMQGNGLHDVMLGDNGDIQRIVDPDDATEWLPDDVVEGARRRVVVLLDREKQILDPVSGGDRMQGNDGSDRMYGEGGSDLVQGNADDDFIQGNQDGDWLEGNDGEDDIIGGSSFLASDDGIPLAGAQADLGDPDGEDAIFGGADADVITGDNARIVRDASETYAGLVDGAYFTSDHEDLRPGWWLGVDSDRLVILLDRGSLNTGAPPVGARFGGDLITGGDGEDVVFGQDGDDWAGGGVDDDTVEGNGGADQIYGDLSPNDVPIPGTTGWSTWAGSGFVSIGADRDGAGVLHGEDDLVGGSNVTHRDGGDDIQGDGEDDFVLGDNGTLERWIIDDVYQDHLGDGARTRIFRTATQLDPGTAPAAAFGDDLLDGNGGDDAIWGQDGDDLLRGQAGDDDLIGELGDDILYGGTGEDAMVGDRGSILNSELGDPDALFEAADVVEDYNGPPFLTGVRYFSEGRFDRRVNLAVDVPGSVGGPFPGAAEGTLVAPGILQGGEDRLRGGPDHDSMHGAWGDDLMNGDQGGDWLFGSHGSDVMWGGFGDAGGTPQLGDDYVFVDRLFGGRGGSTSSDQGVITGGADVLDFRPRDATETPDGVADPDSWFEMTAAYSDADDPSDTSGGSSVAQDHEGTDWIYGGYDRDVMQGDVTDPGPNAGDRMWDWTGAFNLYTHCDPDYGGYNDQRARSPQMEQFLEKLAFDSGVGSSLADVQTSTSSAYRELALVYKFDTKGNNGKAYPTTPGHFDVIAECDLAPDTP